GGPRPVVDEDRADVHEAFFDASLSKPGAGSSAVLRAGRQEMTLGSGRLVALREGVNVPLSFDGARMTFTRPDWPADGFPARPAAAAARAWSPAPPPPPGFPFGGCAPSPGARAGRAPAEARSLLLRSEPRAGRLRPGSGLREPPDARSALAESWSALELRRR